MPGVFPNIRREGWMMESKGRSLDGRFLVPRSIDDSRVLSHLVGASNALLVLEGTRKLCNLFLVETSPVMRRRCE